MAHRSIRSRKRGFSLLEILLAILLLGIGLAVLLQVVSTGLFAGGVNEDEIVAVNLIQEKIEEDRNANFSSVVTEAKAAVPGFSAFSRQVDMTTPQTDLKQLVVTVYYTVGSSEISTSVTTYISNV